MLYSRSFDDKKMDFFVSLLSRVIQGEQQYTSIVDVILRDVHSLTTGEKSYYTIDRDSYPVIVFLSRKDKEYFQRVDPRHFTPADYQHTLQLLSQQRDLAFA